MHHISTRQRGGSCAPSLELCSWNLGKGPLVKKYRLFPVLPHLQGDGLGGKGRILGIPPLCMAASCRLIVPGPRKQGEQQEEHSLVEDRWGDTETGGCYFTMHCATHAPRELEGICGKVEPGPS